MTTQDTLICPTCLCTVYGEEGSYYCTGCQKNIPTVIKESSLKDHPTRAPDSDLAYAFSNNQPQPFAITDILDVKAAIPGHNDEDAWYWVVELRDGRFFLITASCDYTGWDCQSSCNAEEAGSALDAARLAKPTEYRHNIVDQLVAQLAGKQPFGLEIRS